MIFDDVVARVLAWARPSDGDNLIGFALDVDHAFESTGVFESVRVQRTDDPSCLLRINLVAFPTTPTLQDISAALRQAWSQLVYLGFEASMIDQYRDATVMTFVTATKDGGLCVTGEVIATSVSYEQLVLQYEEDFAFAGRIKQR